MTGVLSPALAIAAKDLRLDRRTKDLIAGVGLFALLVVVVASFAFPPAGTAREAAAAGMLWTAFLFAGLLGMGRSFALEKEEGCLDALALAPVPRESIYLGKMLSNLTFTIAAEVAIVPVAAAMMQLPLGRGLPLLGFTIVLTTLGLTAVGTLLASMAAATRTRESFLPVIAIPLIVPALIGGVQATAAALRGASLADASGWLLLLGAFATIFLLVGMVVFPYVLDE